MTQSWRTELRAWAEQCAQGYAQRAGMLGVMIGGSLARGQEWRHSDLELGLLVEQRDTALPYFNVDSGRGVEVIQLVRSELEAQVALAERGDLTPVAKWQIQLWRGRIVHDPSGLLARFKQQFDANLFAPQVVAGRMAALSANIDRLLAEARGLLAQDKPRAALTQVRVAMNDAILALHWAHGELPRSQNRTDSRLRLLCRKYHEMLFYALYREVFGLADANRAIKRNWSAVKTQVLEITRLWGGDAARDFFVHAVDSNFQWRQNAGILTVYRLYIPIIGGPDQALIGKLDDPAWAERNTDLLLFLGLLNADQDAVTRLVEQLADATNRTPKL